MSIRPLNSNSYHTYGIITRVSNTNKKQSDTQDAKTMQQRQEEYSKSQARTDYNPNDTSLSVTFADKNTKTVPTLKNIDIGESISQDLMKTNTAIHTTEDGTRFLVISTRFGNQTFEKSIKLSDNL